MLLAAKTRTAWSVLRGGTFAIMARAIFSAAIFREYGAGHICRVAIFREYGPGHIFRVAIFRDYGPGHIFRVAIFRDYGPGHIFRLASFAIMARAIFPDSPLSRLLPGPYFPARH